MAPFHDLARLVSTQLLAVLETVRAGIIDGTIITTPGRFQRFFGGLGMMKGVSRL